MGLLCRTALVGRIWLALAAALIAIAPDVHCVCPDGQVKQFPLYLSPLVGGCCQGGPVTSDRPSRLPFSSAAPEQMACCQKNESEGAGPSCPKGAELRGERCHKTLTSSTFLTTSPSPTSNAAKASFGELFALVPPTLFFSLPESLPAGRDSWWSAHAPPPTDLVLSLQRLLI
jgi:hypothetical protein